MSHDSKFKLEQAENNQVDAAHKTQKQLQDERF